MRIKRVILSAVLFFIMTSTNVFAQESLLNKVKSVIGKTDIKNEYKNLMGTSGDILKDIEKQMKNMDVLEIERMLGSKEWLNGKNGKKLKVLADKYIPVIIEELKAQLKKAPNDTKLLLKLAIAYQFGAKYSLALTVAEKILALEPDNHYAAIIKAECHKLMGETEKGAAYLEKFIKKQKDNPDLSQVLASMKMDIGQKDKAVKYLESSIGKFPDGEKLYKELARGYEKIGKKGIQIFINGKKIDFSKYGNIEPMVKNGVTMIPVRAVSELLKAKISYEPKTGIVTLIYKDKTIILEKDKKTAKVNGKEIKIGGSVQAVKGRMMVPLRFVSEQFSKKVKWFPFNNVGIVSLN
ncbi:MAG: stalk domain-containing protein [Deltaproteobacteria bacterium]